MNKLSKKAEYSLQALFPAGADLTSLKNAAQAAIVEKWGEDKNKWPKGLRTPFRDQGDKKKENEDGSVYLPDGYVEGAIYLNLKSQNRPGVVDENVQPIMEESVFYAGCWARASVTAYAYDQAGNRGVSFGLNNIQKVGDGDALSYRTKAEDDFKPVEMAAKTNGGAATDLFQ